MQLTALGDKKNQHTLTDYWLQYLFAKKEIILEQDKNKDCIEVTKNAGHEFTTSQLELHFLSVHNSLHTHAGSNFVFLLLRRAVLVLGRPLPSYNRVWISRKLVFAVCRLTQLVPSLGSTSCHGDSLRGFLR